MRVVLASSSSIRLSLLERAGVAVSTQSARIDEEAIIASLRAEGVSPRDIADALAEQKARKVAMSGSSGFVIGADQILEVDGRIVTKAGSPEAARQTLTALSGKTHRLHSACVVFEDQRPVWRHVGRADLIMRTLSERFIAAYVGRNWEEIRHCVGCYQIEGEGPRLFSRLTGDHFSILGLPLIELLSYLTLRGVLET